MSDRGLIFEPAEEEKVEVKPEPDKKVQEKKPRAPKKKAESVEEPEEEQTQKGDITAATLWQPAFNEVWNKTSAFFIGKDNRGDLPRCIYDELFLCGGRACVSGDTKIATPSGEIAIKDFKGGMVYALGKDGKVVVTFACAPKKYAPEQLFKVALKSGRSITVTANHRFLTDSGWTCCRNLVSRHGIVSVLPGDAPKSALLLARSEPYLQETHDEGCQSASLEDVLHCLRTLLGSIYRCWQDCRLCDGQPLSEADTYRDVLRQLADAQTHIQHDCSTDGLEPDDICTHACQCGCHRAIDCLLRLCEGRHCEATENQICEMLFELLSEIDQESRQFQTSGIHRGIVGEVARILLLTKTSNFHLDSSSLAGQIRRELYDILERRVDDQTFSDSIRFNSDVLNHNRLNCITLSEVESITFERVDFFYDMFVPFYNNYIGNGIVNHNSGKSVTASVFVWLAVENDPLKNAVVIRKVGSSLRKSCWKQMMKTRTKLGLFHWEPNKTDMTITNKITGQQIYFVGLDDEEKVRSITVETGYISIAWFEEAKQFKNMEEIDQAVASLLRGGADSDERDYDDEDEGDQEYMTILTYNPPKSNSEWINKEARIDKSTRLVHKSTYLTMPKAWLGRKILSEIEQMKKTKPRQYEHMYLGKVTGTGGEYFQNIEVREITDEEIASFDYSNMGIDWGMNDPNVWTRTYIDTDRSIMYIFDGIYQVEWDRESDKTKYQQFADLVYNKVKSIGMYDDPIWSDAQGKAEASILAGAPWNLAIEFAPKQGVNGRDARYSYMQSLSKIVIDPNRVPHQIVEEFLQFEALPKPEGGWFDKPGKKNDHSCDCVGYGEWETIAEGNANTSSDDDD